RCQKELLMADHSRIGSGRRKSKKARIVHNSSHLAGLGGRTRRMRYLRDAATFLLPVLFTIALQAVAYILIYTRTGQAPLNFGALSVLVLSTVPLLSAFTLSAFRRHEAPILAA